MGAEQSVEDFGCCAKRPQKQDHRLDANAAYDHIQMFRLCEAGQHAMLEDFLKRKGRKVDVSAMDSDGNTPLHIAADYGHLGVCKTLVMRGADVTKRDYTGLTAVDVAREHNHQAIVEFLEGRLNMQPKYFPAYDPKVATRRGVSNVSSPAVREDPTSRQLFPPANPDEELIPATVMQLFSPPLAKAHKLHTPPKLDTHLTPLSVETVFTPPGQPSKHMPKMIFPPAENSNGELGRISIV